MSKYFSYFPLLNYKLDTAVGTNPVVLRNIFFRFKIIDALRNNILIYYDYYVKDGETPEIIAYKYYKDVEKHWLVMMANNIVDPQFDWPLSYDDFQNFIANKYGSFEQALEQFHHYQLTISRTNSISGITSSTGYTIDANTYNNNNLVDISKHLGLNFILGQTNLGQQLVMAGFIPSQVINLSDGSSVTISTNAQIVNCYDFENDLNESKKQIKLISRDYLDQIQKEFLTLSSNA